MPDNQFYELLERGGLNYINNQKNYLIFSAIFPIYLIITQILNIIFILTLEAGKPTNAPQEPPLLDLLTPILILLVISLFALVIFIFLIGWKKNINQYKDQQEVLENFSFSDPHNVLPEKSVTLTNLFYKIVDNMRVIRIIFICLNIICFYYFFWTINFFFIRRPPQHPHPPLHFIVQWLNILSQIALVFYLIFEWKHFYHWNKKFKEIQKFEREIYLEIFHNK
ncbi:MAG: hypothetical protein ACFFAO_20985 [Candidatus Hermodarchaeota archaeon]